MSEVEGVCLIFAVMLFFVIAFVCVTFVIRIESLERDMAKQREKKKDRGKFIEYTAKCKNGKELPTAIPLSDILEVFEYEDGCTAIVRYYKQTFKGEKIPGGDVAIESYEEIMRRIREAERPFDWLPLHPLGGEQFMHFKDKSQKNSGEKL